MSLKTIPGLGKSWTSRIAERRPSLRGFNGWVVGATMSRLSHHGERPREFVEIRARKLRNVINAGAGRAHTSGNKQIGYRRVGSCRGDLHPPVRAVPDPPGEPRATCRFPHEPPKPDALDLSPDLEMNRRHPASSG